MKTLSTLACLLAPLAVLAAPYPELEERQAAQSIDALIKAKGKQYYGVATDQNRLSAGKSAAIIQANFGQVTPENSMKWESIQPQQGKFNFNVADYLVDFAQKNNKTIRGHTLLWHSQLPSWVSQVRDKARLTEVIETHVAEVAGRYKGKIKHWVSSAHETT
jgi:endo-1,4-beta-xylanase